MLTPGEPQCDAPGQGLSTLHARVCCIATQRVYALTGTTSCLMTCRLKVLCLHLMYCMYRVRIHCTYAIQVRVRLAVCTVD